MGTTCTILYFAQAADLAGTSGETVSISASTPAQLAAELVRLHPGLEPLLPHCRFAIDCDFAGSTLDLRHGCDIAVIPPVSGG